MTKVEELFKYLEERGLTLGGLTLTPEGKPSAEEVATELLRAMKNIEEGEYEVVYDSDYPTDSSWEEFDD